MLVYFLAIGNILQPFDMFYCHLVYFWSFGNSPPRFGILQQEQSGNPDTHLQKQFQA
jgi:hypothetical protein